MANIKTVVFTNENLTKLEDELNLFIQKERLSDIRSFKFQFHPYANQFAGILVYSPDSRAKDKSRFFVNFFESDTPEKTNGKLNRFIKDEKFTTHNVKDVQMVEVDENKYVSSMLYITNVSYTR